MPDPTNLRDLVPSQKHEKGKFDFIENLKLD
jgi:hypothetical protein